MYVSACSLTGVLDTLSVVVLESRLKAVIHETMGLLRSSEKNMLADIRELASGMTDWSPEEDTTERTDAEDAVPEVVSNPAPVDFETFVSASGPATSVAASAAHGGASCDAPSSCGDTSARTSESPASTAPVPDTTPTLTAIGPGQTC